MDTQQKRHRLNSERDRINTASQANGLVQSVRNHNNLIVVSIPSANNLFGQRLIPIFLIQLGPSNHTLLQ
eukprot:6484009-Amphidinium_carterae.1